LPTKITLAQWQRFQEEREKYLQLGLQTGPADRPRAEAGVRAAYRERGFDEPKEILWARSPHEGLLMVSQRKLNGQFRDQFRDQLDDQLWSQIMAQLTAQLEDQLWSQLRVQLWDQLRNHLWVQLRGQLPCYGQHDLCWLGYYQAIKDVLELKTDADAGPQIEVAVSSGWWWPSSDTVILSERPTCLHRDDRHRLHNTSGPAIQYPDGWGVWAVHGVRVPQYIIENPENLTPQRITDEENVEVRRIMLERYGAGRYLHDIGAVVLDADVDPLGNPRRLLRAELPNDEPLVMTEVTNSTPELDGSKKVYHERVPGSITTLEEAFAWQWGLQVGEYDPKVET